METNQLLVNEICPSAVQAWIKKGAMLVDVREKNEVTQLAFGVPSIVNIPLSELENRYKELPQDKILIMVCRSGGRSLQAATFLLEHGYNELRVMNMKHGMIRWAQKDFPTSGDTTSVLSLVTSTGCCSTAKAGAAVEKRGCSCHH